MIIYKKLRKWKKNDRTPLHFAAENNSKDLGEILISNGADINENDCNYSNIILFFLIIDI